MKLAIPAALVAVFFVSACDWSPERKQALVDAAMLQIELLNQQGIDPINASPEVQAIIASGCALGGVVFLDESEDVASACAVIGKVAQ